MTKNVYRCDGIDVLEGEEIIVFPNLGARDFPGDDLAENAVFHNKFLLLDAAKSGYALSIKGPFPRASCHRFRQGLRKRPSPVRLPKVR